VYVRDRHSGEALRGLAAGGGRVVVIGFALAESAGVKIDKGGVATDAELRTSDPAIWAAGDIAYAHNPAADRHLRVEHWGEAEAMGEIVGANLAGEHQRWAVAPDSGQPSVIIN
jgi:NADPH-dependent 2,4-dienoyl-CoA reductase/sulfur reductase-like enzyme